MASRGQSLVVVYTAWDTAALAPKTGDVSNHTLRWVKDGTSAAPANAASEVDATNAPGEYKLTLTTAECTADFGKLCGKSSTSGVVIIPVAITFEQLPTAAPNANAGLPILSSSGAALGYTVTLADNAITDAKIAFPAESAGRPTTALAALRRVWEWLCNKRTRDRSTGTLLLRNAADDGTLETQTQSSSGTVDTQTKGA